MYLHYVGGRHTELSPQVPDDMCFTEFEYHPCSTSIFPFTLANIPWIACQPKSVPSKLKDFVPPGREENSINLVFELLK